jgi:hypothetical protein
MSYLDKAKQLQDLIAQGEIMKGFEEFYHPNVQIFEIPTGLHRNGKEAQREAIKEWMESVQEIHGSGCNCVTSDEKNRITTAETWTDVTFKDGNRIKMQEVAVQKWNDDQIIEEKFFYNIPG